MHIICMFFINFNVYDEDFDKSIDNIGFWKRKAGIFREKAGFIGNIMQRACTISDKFKFF